MDWPALANERGTLFEIREALGYNPVQLPRYWAWIRATNPLPIAYNASVLARPTRNDVRVLGVRYLIAPQAVSPTVPGQVIATADGYDLVQVDDAARFVEFRGSWEVIGSAPQAIARVTSEDFDERATVVLEERPNARPSSGTPGGVRWTTPTLAETRIEVGAVRPGVLLIRAAYDPGWRATVDDEPAPVLVVAVPVERPIRLLGNFVAVLPTVVQRSHTTHGLLCELHSGGELISPLLRKSFVSEMFAHVLLRAWCSDRVELQARRSYH